MFLKLNLFRIININEQINILYPSGKILEEILIREYHKDLHEQFENPGGFPCGI